MSKRTTGWAFVGAQVALLVALVALPARGDWPTPAWATTIAYLFSLGGLIIVVVAALRLGPALTPTPVPTAHGELTTSGLYRFVRHPIYTGVLAVVVGLVIRSGSWITLAVGLATVAFFHLKARWEETRLRARYPAYEQYAARTPRFVPRLIQRRR